MASNSSAVGLGLAAGIVAGLVVGFVAGLVRESVIDLDTVLAVLVTCETAFSTPSLTFDNGLGRSAPDSPAERFFGPALTPVPAGELVADDSLAVEPLSVSACAVPWLAAAIAAPTPTATATPPT